MAYHPFRNLGLKALSICIAALLWLVVAGERTVERVMRAPLEMQNLPEGLELVGAPPDTVEVRLRGPSGALSLGLMTESALSTGHCQSSR